MASGGDTKAIRAPNSGDTEDIVEGPTIQGDSPGTSEGAQSRGDEELELSAIRPDGPKKAPARDIAPDPEVGDTIGDYVLLEKIGRGGAGSVFQARRESDGAVVALKVLSAAKVKRARVVQRFFDEVRAASAVKHPSLIRVLDFIEEEHPRRLAYAMEYVDGEALRARLRRQGALDLREAIEVGAEVCQALAALHEAGIIHRDLKPENIMLVGTPTAGGPRVKLLDFGVVKFLPFDPLGNSTERDTKGTFVGTPRYMAPEQAAGGAVEPQTDLFAVGVLLFEMITGACPHEGDSLRDVVMAKLAGAPRITVNPGKEILPQELTDIVDRCLKLKSNLRPKSAREVVRALREAEVILFAVGPVKAEALGDAAENARTDPGSLEAGSPPAPFVDLGNRPQAAGATDGLFDEPTDRIKLGLSTTPEPILEETNWAPTRRRRAMIAAVVVAVLAILVVAGLVAGSADRLPVPIEPRKAGDTPRH